MSFYFFLLQGKMGRLPRVSVADTVQRVSEVLDEVASDIDNVIGDHNQIESDIREVLSEISSFRNFFGSWRDSYNYSMANRNLLQGNFSNSSLRGGSPFQPSSVTIDELNMWIALWTWIVIITFLVRNQFLDNSRRTSNVQFFSFFYRPYLEGSKLQFLSEKE